MGQLKKKHIAIFGAAAVTAILLLLVVRISASDEVSTALDSTDTSVDEFPKETPESVSSTGAPTTLSPSEIAEAASSTTESAGATTHRHEVSDGFPTDHDSYYQFLQAASGTATERIARNIQLVPNTHQNANGVTACGANAARCYGDYPGSEGKLFETALETGNRFADTPSAQLSISDFIVPGAQRYSQIQGKVTDGGRFHEVCQFSHFAYDDPIVFPGQPGAAHLHMFFGNTRANAFSTYESLLNEGGSTCGKGELNRTSYWVPALFDGNDNAIIPTEFMVYYQNSQAENDRAELPEGLKFIHGDAHAEVAQSMVDPDATTEKIVFFSCGWYAGKNSQNTIPNCDNDQFLEMSLRFPFCWNGELDSDDHKSHVVFPDGGNGGYWNGNACPASHPRVLPRIRYRIFFDVKDFTTSTTQAYLSSDVNHETGEVSSGGTTSHGDWFGAWHRETIDTLLENCIHPDRVNCDQQNLGDPEGQRFAYPTKVGGRLSPEQVLEYCPVRSDFDGDPYSVAYCTTP